MMNEELIYGEIGRRIREAREENKLTQEDLGKLVNLTRTSITNIERGKQKIPIDSLYYFAKILNVNVFSLLPNEGFLLSNVELPGNEEELQQFTPDVLNFAKKVYANSKKGEGES
ncbi:MULTISPECIES: helix-turn-helix domain-containing protein [unclassified Paenibacillus]|uniref:helix-turn-helix domain-containing protein n=1 Tax=unclassified Paenibacillus TaxID=185978 RepID=UPI0018CDC552|nr:helix-turn-helix transcriptional regulator [Paenibacillus sp. FSL P4-0081]